MLRLALLILLGLTSAAYANPPRMVISPFENNTGLESFDGLSDGLADLFTVCFSPFGDRIQVVERGALESLMAEKGLSWTSLVDSGFGALRGQVTGAEVLMGGALMRSDDDLVVAVSVYDVATTQVLGAVQRTIAEKHLLSRLCTEFANPILSSLGTSGSVAAELATDQSPELSQLMIDGLGKFYGADYGAASAAFLQVLQTDQSRADARYWLARSFIAAGLDDFAVAELHMIEERSPEHDVAAKARHLLEEIDPSQAD